MRCARFQQAEALINVKRMRRRKEEEGREKKEPFNSVASQRETRCSRSLLRASPFSFFQKVSDFQRLDDSEAFIGVG